MNLDRELKCVVFHTLLALAGVLFPSLAGATDNVSAASGDPPGGIRPLMTELDGRWIGNGVSFSPFRRGQRPGETGPTEAQLLEDLRLVVRHWNLIRMYGSSEETEVTLRLIREHRLPIRMILGAWIGTENSDNARKGNRTQVAGAIRLANEYRDIVVAVNIGNETQVFWSWQPCDRGVLIGYIREVRAAIAQPVTTADDYNFWNKPESRAVAAEVDFIMMHGYALWNSRQLDEAMAWTSGIYDSIRAMHPDRQVIIGETGWATSHVFNKPGPGGESARMKAETSVAAQEEYLRQHNAWVDANKVVTLLFEAFDEPWKGSGPDGDPAEAEKNWGVFTEARRPKASFLAIMRERQPAVALLYADRPLVVGHRGSAQSAPENTLPSFQAALRAGADLVELDYHHSRDGVPVVLHDPTLDRTTDAIAQWGGKDIRVADHTLAELATLDAGSWFAPGFAGTRLPLLTGALDVIQKSAVTLIEHKAGDAATCARLLREKGLVNRVVVQSFDWDFLRALHELVPGQVLGALGPHDKRDGRKLAPDEKVLDDAWLDELAPTGASIVAWNREVRPESVARAHARGLRVFVYTIDDVELARRLIAMGVDGIITNNPGLIAQVRAGETRP